MIKSRFSPTLAGHVRVATFTLLLFSLPGLACVTSRLAFAQGTAKPKVTGTYTSMEYSSQGGDLNGVELKIVLTRKGYQGALQFAEGGPGELILVNLKVDGNRISFVIPDSLPDAGRFEGIIDKSSLNGEFKFKDGGEEKVTLKRARSYWD